MSTDLDHNLTPVQRAIPKSVRAEAYQRIGMTCNEVRCILDEAMNVIMIDLDVPPEDLPIVDSAMSQAFMAIRDEITNKFRDEQMTLLNELRNPEEGV